MPEIFDSFIGGLSAGTEHRENRQRRNALEEAGRLYSGGEFDAAENALLTAGMPDQAANFTVLGEARRGRNNRQAATTAATALGPDATPQQRLQAASTSYINNGEFDVGAQLDETISRMSQREREQASQNAQYLGQQSAQLRAIEDPMARVPAAYQAIEGTPYDTPQLRAEIERLAGADGITNADLDGFEQSLLTYQERLGLQREDQAIARQESQFNRSLAASQANRYSMSAPQARQYGNDYERSQNAINEAVGPQVTSAMPWAIRVAQNGAIPEGTTYETALINDQGMLRAVARLQTGVGVLTDGEVRGTLGDNLANRLQEGGATFMLNERLRPEVRQALAQLVESGVRRSAALSWQNRENAVNEYEEASGGRAPVGWNLPTLPHPQDFGALNAAERIAGTNGAPPLQPNDIRIAPSGREYSYMGPGNWLPRAEGNVEGYQAGRDQRVARGGAPQVSTNAPTVSASWAQLSPSARNTAIQRVRQNPALMQEFQRTFNLSDEEAQRLIGSSRSSAASQGARPGAF